MASGELRHPLEVPRIRQLLEHLDGYFDVMVDDLALFGVQGATLNCQVVGFFLTQQRYRFAGRITPLMARNLMHPGLRFVIQEFASNIGPAQEVTLFLEV